MARIFTVDFEFRGSHHAAVVSTWKADRQSDFFQIALHDEDLQRLVPDGIVRFNIADDGAPQAAPEQAELFHCLKTVVKRYLQKCPL